MKLGSSLPEMRPLWLSKLKKRWQQSNDHPMCEMESDSILLCTKTVTAGDFLNLDVPCGVQLFLPDVPVVVSRAAMPLQLRATAEGMQTRVLHGCSSD